MRPPSMSGHFLLAPIPESSSDCLLPRDIKLAVLGSGRVGKSGECLGDRTGRRRPRAWPGTPGGWGRAGVCGRGGQDPGRSGHPLPPGFPRLPAASTRELRLFGHLLGNAGWCSRSSTCSAGVPTTKDHDDHLWVLQSPQLGPPSFSPRGSRFDGLVRVLPLILLFHFQR